MTQPQRIAEFIQRLAYESLVSREEADLRPDDAPRAAEPTPNYATWNATSFPGYVPFRLPTNR